jgi:hypothetical protein
LMPVPDPAYKVSTDGRAESYSAGMNGLSSIPRF